MAAPRREKDTRRTVGAHQEMMTALGRAAGYIPVAENTRYGNVIGKVGKSSVEHTGQPHVRTKERTPSAANLAEKYRKTIG